MKIINIPKGALSVEAADIFYDLLNEFGGDVNGNHYLNDFGYLVVVMLLPDGGKVLKHSGDNVLDDYIEKWIDYYKQ